MSGLCASGHCRERRHVRGTPVPDGYDVTLARHDKAASVRVVGGLFLGVGYFTAYGAAISYPGRIGALYIPVVGPWLTMSQVTLRTPKVLLAADGALQGAGAILLAAGVIGAGEQLERRLPALAKIRMTPALGRKGGGVLVSGRF